MKGPHGDDLFMSCISELVLETREVSGYFIHPVSNIWHFLCWFTDY